MRVKEFPVKLQSLIEDGIISGLLQSNKKYRIQEIASRFDASIDEIDLILRSLHRKGLLQFSNEHTIEIKGLPQAEIESVFQYAEKSKLKPRTIVREVNIIESNELLAEILRIGIGMPVFEQIRTRLVNKVVLANQYNFIPYEVCPGLENIDLSKKSFQVTLESVFHTVITRIEENYSIGYPSRDDKKILDIEDDTQILIVQRISYSQSGFPLVFADIHVNPAQFHYVENLWPKASPLVHKMS